MMKKLAIVFAVGAAALIGGSAANAADGGMRSKGSTDATQTATDFSAHRRHWRHHWHHHHYRPYYRSYNYYAPRSYGYYGPRYYGPRYYGHRHYGGGPGVTFSFGSGW
jgi:hypothetical protein